MLSNCEVEKILTKNNLKKDIYHLIQYSDEVKELAKQNGNILNRSSIIQILSKLKLENKIPERTSIGNFINYFVYILDLFDEVAIFNEKEGSVIYRYVANYITISPYEIALSLLSKSFLSHYSALYAHDLTLNNPKDIYINKEQSKKRGGNTDTIIPQGRIDYAFSKPMRVTTNILNFTYDDIFFRVHILNSKNTNNTGVIRKNIVGFSKPVQVTNLERTLLDVSVRPGYSGGVNEVLDAYYLAKEKINVEKIIKYLKKIDYSYPYYKSILFYLKSIGLNDMAKTIFNKYYLDDPRNNLKFYLDYRMIGKQLDTDFNIYYPKNLNTRNYF